MRRALVAILAVAAVLGGLGVGMFAAGIGSAASSTPSPSDLAAASPSASPTPEPTPDAPRPARPRHRRRRRPRPDAGPDAGPGRRRRSPASLSHRTSRRATRSRSWSTTWAPARPQSGFNAASVVWQAPAEGGIPRYMMVFQENIPGAVGPVRSSRYYYIAWAAEWRALYAHSGGSPQALRTLREKGNGQLVYNADEFRWANSFWRVTRTASRRTTCTPTASTSGSSRRASAAKDGPMEPAWTFAPDLPRDLPAAGRRIEMSYPYNKISYGYDWKTNRWMRSTTGEEQAARRGRRRPGRAEERDRHADAVRAAQRRVEQAPARGRRRRHGDGLDRDERDGDQGHVAQEEPDRADPVLRRGTATRSR